MVDAVLFRVHVFLVRAFAPVRHADDLHLHAAIDFLKEPGRLLEEPWPERRTELEDAIALFDQAAGDRSLVQLKHMRDKLLAHWARPSAAVQAPTYDELFAFSKLTCSIWEKPGSGAGTIMVPLDYQIDAYRESAEAFWSKWERQE